MKFLSVFAAVSAATLCSLHVEGHGLFGDHDHEHGRGHDCTVEPTVADEARARANEIKAFGKAVNDMSRADFSSMVSNLSNRGQQDAANANGNLRKLQLSPEYKLVGLPIVYVL